LSHRFCMVCVGYDLLCDLLEIHVLNFNKYRSAVVTRRNLVDPIQYNTIFIYRSPFHRRDTCSRRYMYLSKMFPKEPSLKKEYKQSRNISGLMVDGDFPFYFFDLFFIFMCNLFSTYFSILTPFFFSIDIFKFQNRLGQCVALVPLVVVGLLNSRIVMCIFP
jgi:hypothetical protein